MLLPTLNIIHIMLHQARQTRGHRHYFLKSTASRFIVKLSKIINDNLFCFIFLIII